jgi:hypothetical protein
MTNTRRIAIIGENNNILDVSLYNEKDVVDGMFDITDTSIGIGWIKVDEVWSPAKPYSNWILDASSNQWIPPIPKPTDTPAGAWHWHQEENLWLDMIPLVAEENK